jgi:hypothetical protein
VGADGGYHDGYHGFQGELNQVALKGTPMPLPTGNPPPPPLGSHLPLEGPPPPRGSPPPEGPPLPPKGPFPLLVVSHSHEKDYHHY